MENASNAIIIAGVILIAMVVIGIGVYLVGQYSAVGESYEQKRTLAEIEKYNSHFTTFENRTDITTQEVVTLLRYNEQYNKKTGIKADISVSPSISDEIGKIEENSKNVEKINSKTVKYPGYECTKIEYDNSTGRVKLIVFKSAVITKTKPIG